MSTTESLVEFPEYYAKCFDAFQKKSTESAAWTSSLQSILPKLFKHNWEVSKFPNNFKTLSVGCANGDRGDLLICDIVKKFLPIQAQKPTMFYQAVEPNADSLATFRASADFWAQQNSSVESTFQWFAGRWQDYQRETKHDPEKFHFIHFLHSIYYVDIEETLRDCFTNRLADDGLILCLLTSSNSPFRRISVPFAQQTSHDTIISIACKNGWRSECFDFRFYIDVTELLDQSSEEGNLLLDFFTGIKNYRDACDKSQLEMTEKYWLNNSEVDGEGKIQVVDQSSAVIIYKS